MPQSDYWAIPYVLDTASQIRPRSVLDVGVGIGQYGLQLRQILDIGQGRLRRDEWVTRIDGIELFEGYRNPVWDYFYDAVHIGDCRQFLGDTSQQYDLIVLCDVIEHFEREEALHLLELLRARGQWVVVTTPAGHYPQDAVFGNAGEIHRSEWRMDDFRRLGATVHPIRTTFLAVFPGHGTKLPADSLTRDLPVFFYHTGRSLAGCAARWLPRMWRARTRWLFGTNR